MEQAAFPDPWTPEQVAGELALATTRAWMLRDASGGVVAYSTFRVVDVEAELVRIAVLPERRRLGLGRTLLQQTLSRLAAAGVREVFLDVRRDNAGALALYRRLGFERVGRRPRYYRDGTDAILLKRTAEPAPPVVASPEVEC